MSSTGLGRFYFTKLSHRERAKSSPGLWFQLFAGTSLLVWLAAIEAIGAILHH